MKAFLQRLMRRPALPGAAPVPAHDKNDHERADERADEHADEPAGDWAPAALPVAGAASDPPDTTTAGPVRGDPGTASLALSPELQYFSWLTGDPPAEGELLPQEQELLTRLDALTGDAEALSALVPRARAIIPQLMHSLRDDSQSAQALTARVARDPNLVVEVLRLASSVGYGAGTPVADLTQAIGRLGTEGLRRAIARILLKPIFDAHADPLLARTADRLWQHAESTAQLCMQMAPVAHVDPFDAFLAGLMHNVGWTAAFRALDRAPGGAPVVMSAAFIAALTQRREVLFAHLVRTWSVSDSLSALAGEILGGHTAGARLPLGTLLRSADRAAFLQLLRNPAPGS